MLVFVLLVSVLIGTSVTAPGWDLSQAKRHMNREERVLMSWICRTAISASTIIASLAVDM